MKQEVLIEKIFHHSKTYNINSLLNEIKDKLSNNKEDELKIQFEALHHMTSGNSQIRIKVFKETT